MMNTIKTIGTNLGTGCLAETRIGSRTPSTMLERHFSSTTLNNSTNQSGSDAYITESSGQESSSEEKSRGEGESNDQDMDDSEEGSVDQDMPSGDEGTVYHSITQLDEEYSRIKDNISSYVTNNIEKEAEHSDNGTNWRQGVEQRVGENNMIDKDMNDRLDIIEAESEDPDYHHKHSVTVLEALTKITANNMENINQISHKSGYDEEIVKKVSEFADKVVSVHKDWNDSGLPPLSCDSSDIPPAMGPPQGAGGSLVNDYADTSTEPVDYMGGED